jgi:hypothetical protein
MLLAALLFSSSVAAAWPLSPGCSLVAMEAHIEHQFQFVQLDSKSSFYIGVRIVYQIF